MKILSFGVLKNRRRNFTTENFHKTFVDQQFKDMKTKRHEQLKDINMVRFHERVLLIQSIIVCSGGWSISGCFPCKMSTFHWLKE